MSQTDEQHAQWLERKLLGPRQLLQDSLNLSYTELKALASYQRHDLMVATGLDDLPEGKIWDRLRLERQCRLLFRALAEVKAQWNNRFNPTEFKKFRQLDMRKKRVTNRWRK